jgi:phenylacetate-CoA ligase
MTLHCETDDPALQAQATDIIATIRDITKLRGEVRFAPRGSLPNDGKIIDDVRDYS